MKSKFKRGSSFIALFFSLTWPNAQFSWIIKLYVEPEEYSHQCPKRVARAQSQRSTVFFFGKERSTVLVVCKTKYMSSSKGLEASRASAWERERERARARASMATLLALVNLSFAMASIWYLAISVFLGLIGYAVVAAGNKRRNPVSFVCIFAICIVIEDLFDMNMGELIPLPVVRPNKCWKSVWTVTNLISHERLNLRMLEIMRCYRNSCVWIHICLEIYKKFGNKEIKRLSCSPLAVLGLSPSEQ